MNFEQLRIFLAVAECRSFTRAAESLYISHSTTSRSVSALEAALGVQLLMRDNRSVHLTPAGELLFREGERLLRKVENIESAVRNIGLGTQGRLRLSSVNIHAPVLSEGYRAFCGKYPDVQLGIYHRSAAEVFQSVEEGESDLGVTFSFALPEDCGHLEVCPVFQERFCLAVPVGHPLAARKKLRMEELRREKLITVEESAAVGLHRELAQLKELAERAESVPTVESMFLQVRSGNGVALAPHSMACEYGNGCAILRLEDLTAVCQVVLIRRCDNHNPSLSLFLETVLGTNATIERA